MGSKLSILNLQVIRPFLLRRKKDEVEKYLPGKTQVILKCDLSAWQKAYYQQVTGVGRVGLHSGTLDFFILLIYLSFFLFYLILCCAKPHLKHVLGDTMCRRSIMIFESVACQFSVCFFFFWGKFLINRVA